MIYKTFKDIKLSRLGMGNMRLPIVAGGGDKDIDYPKAQAIIDYAMQHGVNYYDSAYVYHGGESEVFLGKALKKYPRESYFVTTKYFVGANPDYVATFNDQLQKLGVERIDFYLIHCVLDGNADEYLTNGCIDFFLQMQKEGKIGYLGFSNHASPQVLERFANHHKWDFAQIQLNYFDWLYGTAKQEYQILAERNIPVMVMESVRGGRLAKLTPAAEKLLKEVHPDWSIPSWAFRWLQRLPQVQVALSGMSTVEQVVDNVATFANDCALTDEEEKLLFQACELFRNELRVPCTACRYCCEGCPAQINIPEVLKVYNHYKVNGSGLRRLLTIETKGTPADCIGCGACTGHCPQGINVPDIMSEVVALCKRFSKDE